MPVVIWLLKFIWLDNEPWWEFVLNFEFEVEDEWSLFEFLGPQKPIDFDTYVDKYIEIRDTFTQYDFVLSSEYSDNYIFVEDNEFLVEANEIIEHINKLKEL